MSVLRQRSWILLIVALGLGGLSCDASSPTDDDDAVGDPCGAEVPDIATTLDVDGVSRRFVLHIPDAYDPHQSYPLIFAWHGLGGDGELAQWYFGIEELAGDDAIIAYPDALPLEAYSGETGWELDPAGYDFRFFDALYDHLQAHLCIQEDRVFSTGHSFGGFMSHSLGCYRGGRFNAIAPVAGGPPYYGPCTHAVAAWITHGTEDDTVLLVQGEQSRDTWLLQNECEPSTAPTQPEPCVAYDGCSRDVHWCQHDGGHEWPDLAAAGIWEFFQSQ